jgi:hypothetical protein
VLSTPNEVDITGEAREPVWDPTLGIPVEIIWQGTAAHRLVTIGDSLTHGFASGAVYQTDLSYSAIIADELGWDGLRYPRYGGPGGLPLNLELLMRELDQHFAPRWTGGSCRWHCFAAGSSWIRWRTTGSGGPVR